jgi:hypothetical protein
MATYEFKINGLTVKFTEQDKENRIAMGERFSKVEFIPKNADGSADNMLLSFNPQERTSAFNAGIRSIFGPVKSKFLHLTNEFHPDRKAGHMGWIHFTLLDTKNPTTMVKLEGKTVIVQNPYTRQPVSNLRVYKASSEWLRLTRLTEYTWKAQNDTTFNEATGVPSASLLHGFMGNLFSGTVNIAYPVITRNTKNGETSVFDNMQKKAQWLFATLQSIAGGEVDFETARHQYFLNALFFRINLQEWNRMKASGQVNAEIDAAVTTDAIAYNNGETIAPRERTVNVDGASVPVNQVVSGNFAVFVGDRQLTSISTLSIIGRRRLEQMAETHNGNLVLKSISI